jgi:uncharacterized protein (DUF433 family)
MPATRTNLLQIQLTEAEKRNIKSLAARQGLTLRQATLQAFQAWELQLPSGAFPADPARGKAAGADARVPRPTERAGPPRQAHRLASRKPSSAPAGGPIPSLGANAQAWLRGAAQLDWSKCPAVQRVQGKTGKVWVVRGTDAPLAEVLQSVADGHPFLEIAEVFEISLEQLIAILQFAAENAAPAYLPG